MFISVVLNSTSFAIVVTDAEIFMRIHLEPSRRNVTKEVKWLNLIKHYGRVFFENAAVIIYFVV